jgi:hypothetical protein
LSFFSQDRELRDRTTAGTAAWNRACHIASPLP